MSPGAAKAVPGLRLSKKAAGRKSSLMQKKKTVNFRFFLFEL